MSKRYQLTARAQMDGAVREPGYLFTLADGELGPHKAASYGGTLKSIPLYEEVKDDPKPEKQEEPVKSEGASE